MAANTTSGTSASRMVTIDGLRGIAAAMVVVYHLNLTDDPESRVVSVARSLPAGVRTVVGQYGGLGVAVFFVISGFVTAHSVASYIATPRFWVRFTVRRIVRLTPPYYAAIVIAIAVAAASSALTGDGFELEGNPFSAGGLIAHLFYAQEALGLDEISSVFWTLCFEMMFYVVYVGLVTLANSISARSHRDGNRLVLVVASALALFFSLGQVQGEFLPAPWLRTFGTFLLGVHLHNACRGALRWRSLALFVVVYSLGAAVSEPHFKLVAVATLVIIGAAARRRRLDRWLGGRGFQFVGQVSYSLYLIHSVVFSVCYFAVDATIGTDRTGQMVYLAVALIVALVAAWVLWRCVEVPATTWARTIALGPSATTAKQFLAVAGLVEMDTGKDGLGDTTRCLTEPKRR